MDPSGLVLKGPEAVFRDGNRPGLGGDPTGNDDRVADPIRYCITIEVSSDLPDRLWRPPGEAVYKEAACGRALRRRKRAAVQQEAGGKQSQ
jgi:hypothetical protein